MTILKSRNRANRSPKAESPKEKVDSRIQARLQARSSPYYSK
ncbi:hypothetical protein [Helicobacter canis]|nr:hypothetical protein [Helicobacter canis]